MTIHIRNDQEYEAAMVELRHLMELNPPLGTPEGLRLSILASLTEAYECGRGDLRKRFPPLP